MNDSAINRSAMSEQLQKTMSTPVYPHPATDRPDRAMPIAAWSYWLAVFGFITFFVLSIPAVVCGHIALAKFKRNPNQHGKGMAIGGLIIGYAGLLIGVNLAWSFYTIRQWLTAINSLLDNFL